MDERKHYVELDEYGAYCYKCSVKLKEGDKFCCGWMMKMWIEYFGNLKMGVA